MAERHVDGDVVTLTAPPLALPAPLTGEPVGGYVQYSHRYLSWGPLPAGEYARNRWDMAWVEVREDRPWKGEPLWLTAYRRPPGHGISRVPFTDKGRDTLHAEVVPVIARYGFDRLWTEARGASAAVGVAERNARDARVEAAWFDAKATVQSMLADGLVEFRPAAGANGRPLTVRVVNPHSPQRRTWDFVAAEALVAGERVGWVTRDGDVVPEDTMLRGAGR